ncbi:hypothetical protein XENTR_v10000888 [Xenopus tropicalis]|nr:hypothetical protein XENTR_v10000888 [Xenopus tropicalis]
MYILYYLMFVKKTPIPPVGMSSCTTFSHGDMWNSTEHQPIAFSNVLQYVRILISLVTFSSLLIGYSLLSWHWCALTSEASFIAEESERRCAAIRHGWGTARPASLSAQSPILRLWKTPPKQIIAMSASRWGARFAGAEFDTDFCDKKNHPILPGKFREIML